MIIKIILSYFAADFISGLFHWFSDNYLHYFANKTVIDILQSSAPNHHKFPADIINHWFAGIINHIIIGLFFSIATTLILRDLEYAAILFIFSLLINFVHLYNHCHNANIYLMEILQYFYILSPRNQHKSHHTEFVTNYCILGGILNILLEKIYFWRKCEALLFYYFKLKPGKK